MVMRQGAEQLTAKEPFALVRPRRWFDASVTDAPERAAPDASSMVIGIGVDGCARRAGGRSARNASAPKSGFDFDHGIERDGQSLRNNSDTGPALRRSRVGRDRLVV